MLEIVDTYLLLPAVLITASDAPIRSMAWHPGGQRLAVASEDGSVKIIEPRQGSELLTLRIESGACSLVAWSPDGERLAVSNDAGVVRVWDASRGFEFAKGGQRWDELAWNLYDQSELADDELQRDYLQRTLEVAPKELDYRFLRGNAYARLGQFEESAREFAATVPEQMNEGLWMARWQALALLGARDLDAYRALYASMMSAVHDSEVWSKRLFVAWLGTLDTNTTKEFDADVQAWLEELARLYQQQENNEPGLDEVLDYNGHLIYAALLYRRGEYARAERFLNKLVASLGESAAAEGQRVQVCAHYFLAMARHQMGHEVQARRLLAKADRLSDSLARLNPKWHWQVEVATLQREATDMIDLE
jgi:tetratricopeptide (TPR) repeat protein